MLLTMVPERASEHHPKWLTPRSLGALLYTQKYTFYTQNHPPSVTHEDKEIGDDWPRQTFSLCRQLAGHE